MEEQKQDLSPMLPSPVPKKQTKNKQNPVGERLVSAVERSVHSREQREKELESDCDRMFLLSLLNPLKQIPEHARFGVKRKLMEVIEAEMKIYRPTPAPQMNPQYQFQQNRSTNSEQLQLQNVNLPCSSSFIATNTQHSVVQRLPSADQRFDIDSPSTYPSNSVMSPCSDIELF
jgi:hypothetical protein